MRKKDRISFKVVFIIIVFLLAMMFLLFSGVIEIDLSVRGLRLRVNDENKLVVSFRSNGDCYVAQSKDKNHVDDALWRKATNNSMVYDLVNEPYYYFVKCEDKVHYVGSNENLGSVDLSIDNFGEKYLIAPNTYNIDYHLTKHGYITDELKWTSSDESVAIVNDGAVKVLGNGEVTISASLLGKEASINLLCTNLIVDMPKEFDPSKELLPCERYTKEENDMLDELLEYRINEAGYQTRGGVVAATRFLLLEFPYRLTYFYEWGRQNWDKVDGEGRYYIKGLYLDESRFSRLLGSNTGPETWGCKLYSTNLQQYDINGLDCSGFVTWVLLNAGFDVGDIGSGFSKYYNLTNTGKLEKNSMKTLEEVKVGDLTHSNYMGGHIGILTAIDNDYYYVAQATPKNDWGVTLTKYDAKQFIKEWQEIVLMDSYYKAEGNYTDMWY